jgi:predicted metal-dependent phosphoesterase TrpH
MGSVQPAMFCETALEYEYRDGLFHITDPNTGQRRAMQPHVFHRSFHNAAKAIRDFHSREGAEIIEFPRAHG